jgi:hypothetical protein
VESLNNLVQFYAPLVGLLGFAFALGILWQRVKVLEKAGLADENTRERLIRLEVKLEALPRIEAQIEGLHREIGAMLITPPGTLRELHASRFDDGRV